MDFRKATANDIEEICLLVQNAIAGMEENGIHQWDDVYPTREDFQNDIHSGNLYAGIVDGTISVVFVLNKCQDEAYLSADWSYRGERFRVLHRLCVNPQFQNQGVAKKTLIYIEEKLSGEGIESIRLDVFTQNPFALRLYEKAGYRKTGTADWRKGKFILMEKVLRDKKMKPKEKLTLLDDSYLEQMADLFKKAFAGEPWKDDWSDRTQLLEYIKEISSSYNALNFGLIQDGKLIAMAIGMIRHWWEGTNYNIEELCVDPDFQGQGIGTHFMKLIEDEIKKKALHGLFLQTDSDKPAYKFYLKNGFKNLEMHVSLYKSVR